MKKKYWYMNFVRECVICGKKEVWKERRYTEKPKDIQYRYDYAQTACSGHFC